MKHLLFLSSVLSLLLVACGETDDFGDLTYFNYVNSTQSTVVIEKWNDDGLQRSHEIMAKDSINLPSSLTNVVAIMDDLSDSSQVILRFVGTEDRCFIYPLKEWIENDIRLVESYTKVGETLRFEISDTLQTVVCSKE